MHDDELLILGVDPGTLVTGYGIVRFAKRRLSAVDCGCIRPPASLPPTKRYRIIFEGIHLLLKRHAPQAMVVETQFVHKNPQSAIKLGMARGVITLASALLEIPVFEYAPSRVKQAVVGSGRASKTQVQAMVRQILMLKALPQPEDAADALALAICHSHAVSGGWNTPFEV